MKELSESYSEFVSRLWNDRNQFTHTYIGRQKIPFVKDREEDHCEIIMDNMYQKYYLMVPGSGSFYYELNEEEVKSYLNK
jgi:hypothetical protein